MTERGFNTKFWTDPFIRKLSPEAKLLYVYLWTNDHCNQAGIYEMPLDIMAFETKIDESKLQGYLETLQPKITWFKELDILWVKSFVHYQAKSPKFLIAVANCLKNIGNNGLVKEYIEYNSSKYSISIPYQYNMDSVSIPTTTITVSRSISKSSSNSKEEDKGVIKGDKGKLQRVTEIYEKNIGLLTPIIGEELKDIANEYPVEWFEEAVKEACKNNVRKLRYITSILENWKVNGFKSGKGKKVDAKGKKSREPSEEMKEKYGL